MSPYSVKLCLVIMAAIGTALMAFHIPKPFATPRSRRRKIRFYFTGMLMLILSLTVFIIIWVKN